MMGIWEILLIAACAAVVIGVAVASYIRKKQGKCSCDCGGDCAHCKACKNSEKVNREK